MHHKLTSLGNKRLSGSNVEVDLLFYLQVVEDEKERFCRQSLVELYRVGVVRWYLMVEGQRGTRIPHQVLSVGKKQSLS